MENPSLVLHSVPDAEVLTLIYHLLCRLDRHAAISSNHLCCLQSFLQTFLGLLKYPRCEAPFAGLLAAEVFPCEYQLHSPRFADCTRETLTTAGAGDSAELDLRLTERCGARAVDDISHHGKLTAAPKGIAIDCGDKGLFNLGSQRRPKLYKIRCIGRRKCKVFHFLNVRTGCYRSR